MNITNEEDTEEVDDDKDQIEDNHTNLGTEILFDWLLRRIAFLNFG
jgi:hypothetical protein